MNEAPLKVVYICSDSRRDRAFLDTLSKHLVNHRKANRIEEWHTGLLEAGAERDRHLDHHLNEADILILLISVDFLNSPSAYEREMPIAMDRHNARKARVIPILLRACDTRGTPFGDLTMLPKDRIPVDQHKDREAVFAGIAKEIGPVILELLTARTLRIVPPQKPRIPKELLHLCDRQKQHDGVQLVVHTEYPSPAVAWSHRPLVCVIHGTSDQCLTEFKERLRKTSLPEFLGAELPLEDYQVLLPETGKAFPFLLQKNLARNFGDSSRSADDVASLISRNPARVLVYSRLYSDQWSRQGFNQTDDFFSFWNDFPNLSPEHRLICCLLIIHQGESLTKARRFLKNLERQGRLVNYENRNGRTLENLYAVVLPELESVRLIDATNWIYGRHFRKLCAEHDPFFCDPEGTTENVEEFYRTSPPDIPMRRLILQLEEIASNRICKGY